MKKLLAIIFTLMLLFTACGEKEPEIIGGEIYKNFVFDETRIVSKEKVVKEGREHIYFIEEYDEQGRVLRSDCYTARDLPVNITEYMYNSDGSYYTKTVDKQGGGDEYYVSFSYSGADERHFEKYHFMYSPQNDSYRLNRYSVYNRSADDLKEYFADYDENGIEILRNTAEYNSDGELILTEEYENGKITGRKEFEYNPYKKTVTSFSVDGKEYVTILDESGNIISE